MRRAIVLVLLFAAASPHAAGAEPDPPPHDTKLTYAPGDGDLIRALGQRYLSNREAFPFLKCRFILYEGFAESVDLALEGKLLGAAVSSGTWIVDGSQTRYELTCDREPVDEAPKHDEDAPSPNSQDQSQSPLSALQFVCAPEGFLADGEIHFRYHAGGRTARVYDSSELPLPGATMTPFAMDVMGDDESYGPGRLLTEGAPGGYEHAWIEGTQQTENGELTVVCTGWEPKESGRVRRRMYIDPNRGCLAVRCFTYFKDPEQQRKMGPRLTALFFTDIQECSPQRWFPWRAVLVREPDSDRSHLHVKIIEVLELDAEERPAETDFVVELPAGTSIVDPSELRSSFRLRQTRRIGPPDLRPLLDETRRVLQQKTEETQAGSERR